MPRTIVQYLLSEQILTQRISESHSRKETSLGVLLVTILYIYVYVYGCLACMYARVPCVHLVPRRSEEALDPLELKSQLILNLHVGTGN